jgi:hypothetical protein
MTKFSENLRLSFSTATDLVGRKRALSLASALLSEPNKAVRIEACLLVAVWAFPHRSCLATLEHDPEAGEYAIRIKNRIIEAAELDKQLYRHFLSARAMEWVRATANPQNEAGIEEVLNLLRDHPDPQIRRKACQLTMSLKRGAASSTCE